MDEITCVMKSDFVGRTDGFDLICTADFIRALRGFHREHSERFHLIFQQIRYYHPQKIANR